MSRSPGSACLHQSSHAKLRALQQQGGSKELAVRDMVKQHCCSLGGCASPRTAPPHKLDPNPGTFGQQQGSSPTPCVTAVSLTLITLPTNHLNHRRRGVCTRTLFLEQRRCRLGTGSTPALARSPPPPARVSSELFQLPVRNVLLQPGPSRGQQ